MTIEKLAPTPGMMLSLEPDAEERALRETVAAIAARYGHEYFMECSRAGEAPTKLWNELGDLGFLGTFLPPEWGGGQGLWSLTIITEELAAAGCPLNALVFSQAICGNLLASFGTDEQKQRWLPGIASGRIRFAFAITEPDAGSNSHNISTRADREGDGWVLRGHKTFISGVEASDVIVVVARTGQHPDTGRGLLSLFIVDADDPKLTRQAIPTAITSPERQWGLWFDDVLLGPDRLIGVENEGLRAVFAGLNPERVLGAALSTGIGRYALEKAIRYAKERQVWGVPIGSHQGVSHPLAEAKIELELARLITHKAAKLYEAGSRECGEAANMAKYAAGEASVKCLDVAIQAHGGNGVTLEYGLTDMWWLARLTKIAPVSREMVLNFVATHSLGLPASY